MVKWLNCYIVILLNNFKDMKLLLTSTGLANKKIRDFFIGNFDDLNNKKACLITAGKTREEQEYIEFSKKELSDLGIKITEVNIAKNEKIFNIDVADYDIYYVCGGNTFYILDRIRKTGMDRLLIKAIKDGKFYIGVSAGSIIMAKDIEIAGWGMDGDSNDINLADFTGLNLIPYLIFPHYTKKNEQEVIEFKKKRGGEPVLALTDNQVLSISDEGAVLLGDKGGLQLCDGFEIKDKTF